MRGKTNFFLSSVGILVLASVVFFILAAFGNLSIWTGSIVAKFILGIAGVFVFIPVGFFVLASIGSVSIWAVSNMARFFFGLIGIFVLAPVVLFIFAVVGILGISIFLLAIIVGVLYAIAAGCAFIFYVLRKEPQEEKTKQTQEYLLEQGKDVGI